MVSRDTSDKDDFYDRRNLMTNGFSGGSIGEYTAGVSMLDISTRLRIAEAELAIVRNEVSELVAEKNTLEMQSKKHENSWKFALLQLGRTIEERNEALARLPSLVPINRDSKSPEIRLKKMKAPALKAELESSLMQLETQIRVSRQIEQERDKANDELEFAKSQICTLMIQHGDLLGTCSEVARERNRAVSEAKLLREELNKYDKELNIAVETELGEGGEYSTEKEKILLHQIRLLKDDKVQSQRTFQQTVEQCKRQITKCNMERRQTSTSADAMRALQQRRLESAQSENAELRCELRASGEMITQLKDQLAQVRIACQHHNGYTGDGGLTNDDTPPDSQTSENLLHIGSGNIRHIPPHLSQDSGMLLYNTKTEGGEGNEGMNSELITPGGGYCRVSSARGSRKNPYVPTASPFPEEPRENSSEEEASWI